VQIFFLSRESPQAFGTGRTGFSKNALGDSSCSLLAADEFGSLPMMSRTIDSGTAFRIALVPVPEVPKATVKLAAQPGFICAAYLAGLSVNRAEDIVQAPCSFIENGRPRFATDLPANLFLACFSLNSLHLFSCSNSLLNNLKHAQ
jgi:hypothetical protein